MRIPVCGVLAALLIVVAVPAPAYAGPTIYQVVSPTIYQGVSLTDAKVLKTASVDCPAGEFVHGVGGWTTPAGVMLTGIVPSASLTSATATGYAPAGFIGDWSVTVLAICGPGTGVDRVTGTGGPLAVTACSTNKVLYSSGYQIERPTGAQYVYGVVPTPDLSALSVHAAGIPASSNTLTAIGICGPVDLGDPFFKARRHAESSQHNANSPKIMIAGKPPMSFDLDSRVSGGGALIHGSGVFLDGLTPLPNYEGAMARASRLPSVLSKVAFAAVDDDEWDLDTYSNCIGSWY